MWPSCHFQMDLTNVCKLVNFKGVDRFVYAELPASSGQTWEWYKSLCLFLCKITIMCICQNVSASTATCSPVVMGAVSLEERGSNETVCGLSKLAKALFLELHKFQLIFFSPILHHKLNSIHLLGWRHQRGIKWSQNYLHGQLPLVVRGKIFHSVAQWFCCTVANTTHQ